MKKALLFAGIGCLSLVLLLVLVIGGTLTWAAFQARELGSPVARRVERRIAVGDGAGEASAGAGRVGPGPAATGSRTPHRLDVDLMEGRFTIGSGPRGGDLEIAGEFAEGYYQLTEEHVPGDTAGGPVTRIRFAPSASFLVRMVGGLMSGGRGRGQPRLTVLIPEDLPVALSLRVGMGEAEIDLGGLTLTGLAADLSMGNHRLGFSRPVAGDIQDVDMRVSMGNVTLENLGNARARRIATTGSMGSVQAELGGDWRPGSVTQLSFNQTMGELRLRVPDTVRLMARTVTAGGNERVPVEDDRDARVPDAPVLEIEVTTSMAESRISRY